jgi:conjugative transfer region protein TrbK
MRPIAIRTLSCAVAAIAITAAAALTAVRLWHVPVISLDPTVLAAPAATDPLTRELARCREIGTAAASDPACKAAWAENRRRFFTYTPSPAPAPEAK